MIIKKVNGFLMLSLLGAAMMASVARGDDTRARLQAVYTRMAEKIETDYAVAKRERPARYRSALNETLLEFQKQGNLKGVLAVREERKRFDQKGSVPAEPDAKTPPIVTTLQAEWHKQNAQEDLIRHQSLTDLADKYIARLDTLKRERTIEGRFDDAIAVQKEIERVRQSPAVTAAQFELALREREAEEAKVPDRPVPEIKPEPSPEPKPSAVQPPVNQQDVTRCASCEGTGKIADACPACRGTGQCSSCNGTGRRRSGFRGSNAQVGCISCKITGRCRQCDGTGKQTRVCPVCQGTGKAQP